MPLLKNGSLSADLFLAVPGDDPLPPGQAVLIAADRLLAGVSHDAPLGVIWPNHRPVAELAPHLPGLALVALVWPGFRDGRAYSQARLLRQRHGFSGEIRATGQVLQDQILLMQRCGVDAFEITKDADIPAAQIAGQRYRTAYQAVDAGRPTVFEQRRAALAARAAG